MKNRGSTVSKSHEIIIQVWRAKFTCERAAARSPKRLRRNFMKCGERHWMDTVTGCLLRLGSNGFGAGVTEQLLVQPKRFER